MARRTRKGRRAAPEAGPWRTLGWGSLGLGALGFGLLLLGVLWGTSTTAALVALAVSGLGGVAAALGVTLPVVDARPPRRELLLVGFAMGWLAFQVVVPAAYYLGDDPYDERFSWRMFSGIRVAACDVVATEIVGGRERRIDLRRAVHVAWANTLRRGRPAVLARFLAWRCDLGAAEARVSLRCRGPDGAPLPAVRTERQCGGPR